MNPLDVQRRREALEALAGSGGRPHRSRPNAPGSGGSYAGTMSAIPEIPGAGTAHGGRAETESEWLIANAPISEPWQSPVKPTFVGSATPLSPAMRIAVESPASGASQIDIAASKSPGLMFVSAPESKTSTAKPLAAKTWIGYSSPTPPRRKPGAAPVGRDDQRIALSRAPRREASPDRRTCCRSLSQSIRVPAVSFRFCELGIHVRHDAKGPGLHVHERDPRRRDVVSRRCRQHAPSGASQEQSLRWSSVRKRAAADPRRGRPPQRRAAAVAVPAARRRSGGRRSSTAGFRRSRCRASEASRRCPSAVSHEERVAAVAALRRVVDDTCCRRDGCGPGTRPLRPCSGRPIRRTQSESRSTSSGVAGAPRRSPDRGARSPRACSSIASFDSITGVLMSQGAWKSWS